MSQEYDVYHQQFLAALTACEGRYTTEIEKVEACFKCSLDYWGKLQKQVRQYDFPSSAEEIHFFKKIKPRFTAYIEYYTCRYHALLFMPTDDNLELVRFWKWEMRKTEKFFENNESFCRYMQEDATEKDEAYFLRASNNGVQVMHGRIHDVDPRTATPADYLVTMIRAYEMYQEYIRTEMQKPGGYFFLTK